MRACVTLVGDHIRCHLDGKGGMADVRIQLDKSTLARMQDLAARYEAAVRGEMASALSDIGHELFAWLDGTGWASAWARDAGERVLEVSVEDPDAPQAEALLDLPWELLATRKGYLAGDTAQPFVVYRVTACDGAQPATPPHGDLALMFMAAAPEGLTELDYEAEEVAIGEATQGLSLHLSVEESGSRTLLEERLAQEGPFEAVHISCHGTIRNGVPELALEKPEGGVEWTDAKNLIRALGKEKALFVFLSACRTAEAGIGGRTASLEPFVRTLVRGGVANVLGWDGSVYDMDAREFARSLYRGLAEHQPVPYAAAIARGDLLLQHQEDPKKGRHWHLARVYVGPEGGGPLCQTGKPTRSFRQEANYEEFLGRPEDRVPVATAKEFVGRRRQAQQILDAFRDKRHSGVLIHGGGRVGKSSLAARVAHRMPRHTAVVVFENYDALSIFARLRDALPPKLRDNWIQDWEAKVGTQSSSLADALEEALCGPFADKQPILLVIDDLEQILEAPRPDQKVAMPVKDAPGKPDAFRDALGAVLRAFDKTKALTHSRLLLTSRFPFTLPDGKGGDLATSLKLIPLPPMLERERVKQWQALVRAIEAGGEGLSSEQEELAERVLEVAGGNPGLQATLSRPILSGELNAAQEAVSAVEEWRRSGKTPVAESELAVFLQRISLEKYVAALTEPQRTLLRAAKVFSDGLPVPLSAIHAVGRAAGVGDPGAATRRLFGLGLLDTWGKMQDVEHASANSLARPLLPPDLAEKEAKQFAAVAIPELVKAWQDEDGDFPQDPRGVELAQLALVANASAKIVGPAAYAAATFLFRSQHNAKAALSFLIAALEKMDKEKQAPAPQFVLLASNCAERLGETAFQEQLLERGLSLESDDKIGLAQIRATYAEATMQRIGPDKALEMLNEAARLLAEAGDVRSVAITRAKIADILAMQDELGEALRIRREEALPVFERLGDVYSLAVAKAKIAEILAMQGELDEALRIYREEVVPVLERLGDVRSVAVTKGLIADILFSQGKLDEALRIYQEDELPVYERLGDVGSAAVAKGKVADILFRRGELDAALRIRREETLPVYERLGDVRSVALTKGQIADILVMRGELDEALPIYREDAVPVFERLGDVRELAVAKGKIADILVRRGDLDEALRICQEEVLPAFERLGDVGSVAITKGQIDDLVERKRSYESTRPQGEKPPRPTERPHKRGRS